MWSWLTGASTKANDDTSTTHTKTSTSDMPPATPTTLPRPAASAGTGAPLLPVALDEHGQPIPIGGVSGSSPPADGSFWGFMDTNVAANDDPALDDMMSFFGFSHRERESDYVGCVSFELSYPDGQKSIRTVQVLAKGPEHGSGATLEEMTTSEGEAEPTLPRQHPARAIRYDEPAAAAGRAAVAARASRLSSWFQPTCTLYLPRIAAAMADGSGGEAVASSSGPALPRMPFSSRVRIHSGPVPSDVPVTARLICSRDIFFEVYLGRLDPVRSVLTGKAHCPGWRYRELMHFGQSFDCSGPAWVRFYAKQKEVEEAKQGKKGGGTGSSGSSNGGGGATAQLTAPAPQTAPSPAKPAVATASSTSLAASAFSSSFHFPRPSMPLHLLTTLRRWSLQEQF